MLGRIARTATIVDAPRRNNPRQNSDRDVRNSAKLVQEDHKDRNFFIVAHATDGHMATYSLAEPYNHTAEDIIFILYEENGSPIGAQGEYVLVSTTDKKTGPRHVHWLNGVEVRKVRPAPAGA